MRKLLYLVTVLLLVAPTASWAAGALGINDISKSMTASGITVSGGGFTGTHVGLDFGVSSIGSVGVAVALEEFGVNMQSPYENFVSFSGDGVNLGLVTDQSVLSHVQQAIGAANVSLSLNSVVTGINSLSGSAGLCGSGNDCDATLAFVLSTNPAFTVLNSYPVAQMLLVREAIGQTILGTGSVLGSMGIGIDLLNVGVAEFSPHQNAGSFAGATNSAVIASASVMSVIQQAVGVANVQVAINQILVGSTSITASGISAGQ